MRLAKQWDEQGSLITTALFLAAGALVAIPATAAAQAAGAADEQVTFSKHVAPILQEKCQNCHNPQGVAPMSLVTYEEVRPWAPMIKHRTGIRDRMGAMPPWYVEKDIGIQDFKNDPSLNDEQVETIANWVDAGAPQGDPADMPPALSFDDTGEWRIRPDLIVRTPEFFVPGGSPDMWIDLGPVPLEIPEDRYVSAVEIRETNTIDRANAGVGARQLVHHMLYSTVADGEATTWPVHEVGRNEDILDPRAGRLLKAGSQLVSSSIHLNSGAEDATAYLEIAYQFHPKGYEPEYRGGVGGPGDAVNIDLQPMKDGQELHAYHTVTEHTKLIAFEPHLHAPGERMCIEAIWGFYRETLSCVGYDHNWVRAYPYAEHAAPLLPKGTILHITGFMNNTPDNPNIVDPRNWQGSGNRSVANMFLDLSDRVALTDEQFAEEMAQRRETLNLTKNDWVIGCPLCLAPIPTPTPTSTGTATDN